MSLGIFDISKDMEDLVEESTKCDNNPLRVRADQTLVWSNILVTRPKVNKDIYWILNYCQIIKDITVRALSIILLMEVSDVPNKIQ